VSTQTLPSPAAVDWLLRLTGDFAAPGGTYYLQCPDRETAVRRQAWWRGYRRDVVAVVVRADDRMRAVAAACPPLSARQRQVLGVVRGCIAVSGRAPSLRRIAQECGLSSASTAKHHVDRLVVLGLLERGPGSLALVVAGAA
jgi:hypothetical protein